MGFSTKITCTTNRNLQYLWIEMVHNDFTQANIGCVCPAVCIYLAKKTLYMSCPFFFYLCCAAFKWCIVHYHYSACLKFLHYKHKWLMILTKNSNLLFYGVRKVKIFMTSLYSRSVSMSDMVNEEEVGHLPSLSQSRHERMNEQYSSFQEEEDHWQDVRGLWYRRSRTVFGVSRNDRINPN